MTYGDEICFNILTSFIISSLFMFFSSASFKSIDFIATYLLQFKILHFYTFPNAPSPNNVITS